jgi:hypothetical protein
MKFTCYFKIASLLLGMTCPVYFSNAMDPIPETEKPHSFNPLEDFQEFCNMLEGMGIHETPQQALEYFELTRRQSGMVKKPTEDQARTREQRQRLRHLSSSMPMIVYGVDIANPEVINVKDVAQKTLLYTAAEQGRLDYVLELIAHKADCTITGPDGLTPEQTAEAHGHTDIVRILQNYARTRTR